MHRVVLLDHLDTRPAILGDLVDVRAFEQPERNVAVAQGIERPPVALAIELQPFLFQDPVELLLVVNREQTVGRFRLIAFNHPLNGSNCTGGASSITYAALAADFGLEDRLASSVQRRGCHG